MSIRGKNWNRQIIARLISKNKVRVVLTCYRVHHGYNDTIASSRLENTGVLDVTIEIPARKI